jgi:UbiD family decarboxylase
VHDLRSYLNETADAVFRVEEPVSTVHAITALQYALEAAGRFPIVRVAKPLLADGRESAFEMICNLTASRVLTAAALGIDDHRRAARTFAERAARTIDPVVVVASEAPVREVVLEGDAADLTVLPALTQHVTDPGPYLTAAHATTTDPQSGVDNTAIQRCWIKGPRLMSYYPYPASHNRRNVSKFWARGEACPIAFWIGHHPAVVVGAQAKLVYPESHWGAAGGLLGAPVRLTPSLTHGDQVLVPAEAEIVIEGWVPANREELDGPFGEYTGYAGPAVQAPVCEITCISHRRDAIYHDYGSGLADSLVPDNLAMEGKLYGMVKPVAPSLENIHVPVSGRRFHGFLQFGNAGAGEVRDALTAALAYRRIKTAIAVGEDIDIFSDAQIMWALATRVQWERDAFQIPGLSTSNLDPSLPPGEHTTTKQGIDATLPPGMDGTAPPPVSRVPDDAFGRARTLVSGTDPSGWLDT